MFIDRPPEAIEADAVLIDNRSGGARRRRPPDRCAGTGESPSSATASRSTPPASGVAATARPSRGTSSPSTRRWFAPASTTSEPAFKATRSLLAARRSADGHAHEPEPHHGRRRARAARGGPSAGRGVVGIDDLTLADALEPAVTVVAQDPIGLGHAAAELLFARLDGEGGTDREQVLMPTELIMRGSGEIGPGDGYREPSPARPHGARASRRARRPSESRPRVSSREGARRGSGGGVDRDGVLAASVGEHPIGRVEQLDASLQLAPRPDEIADQRSAWSREPRAGPRHWWSPGRPRRATVRRW